MSYLDELYQLDGKIALVTGAGQGIGEAIALALMRCGATAILAGRTESKLVQVERKAKEFGGNCAVRKMDIADPKEIDEGFAWIEKTYGRLDILVNNAGVSQSTKLEDYQPEDFAGIMNLNVNALFNAIQPAVKIMRAQGGGVILNTSSMVSISGQPSGVGYPTSKFAVNGMTLSLARELGPSNIRVNGVAPGVTRTDMVAALPENMIKPLIATIPLRRVGEPEDIANAFLFLASDMASYITGEILSVDGAARS